MPRMTAIVGRLAAFGAVLLLVGCAAATYYREGQEQIAAGQYEAGLASLQKATQAAPEEPQYRATYLRQRERVLSSLFNQADALRGKGRLDEAEKLYKRIGELDPHNDRVVAEVQQLAEQRAQVALLGRMRELIKQGDKGRASALLDLALRDNPRQPDLLSLRRELQGDTPVRAIAPSLNTIIKRPINLEFRNANLKMVFEALTRNTGLNFVLDRDVRQDLTTTIFVKKVPLEDAIDLILTTSHLEKKILNSNTVLIYPNSPEKQAEYQDLVIKSFYVTNVDAKRIGEMLKALLKVRSVYVDDKLGVVAVRDTPDTVALAGRLIATQDLGDSEVMLDVEVLEVNRSRLTELGLQFPKQLTLTPLAIANKANLLLSDIRGLNSNNIVIDGVGLTINMQRDTGDTRILANPRIRARNHEKANILIGDKLPVVTTSTTSTGVTSESIQYVDVGLKLDVEPSVYLDNEVGIKIGMEVSSLGSQLTTKQGTVAYQISTRNAATLLRLKDGETQVLAGLINDTERNSASKLPGLGDLPLLGRLFSSQQDNNQKTEIVLAITPHILRTLRTPLPQDAELWSGTENYLRLKPMNLESGAADKAPMQGASIPAGEPEGVIGNTVPVEEPADPNTPVKAALSFDVSNKDLKVGDTATVTVKLKADGGIRSLPLQIGFDAKLLQVQKVTEGSYFKQGDNPSVFSSTVSEADGKVYVSAASTNFRGAKGDAPVLSFTVTAKAAGKAEIKFLSVSPIAAGEQAPVLEQFVPLQLTVQ